MLRGQVGGMHMIDQRSGSLRWKMLFQLKPSLTVSQRITELENRICVLPQKRQDEELLNFQIVAAPDANGELIAMLTAPEATTTPLVEPWLEMGARQSLACPTHQGLS